MEEWLGRLREDESNGVRELLDELFNYSKDPFNFRVLKTCGVYAVGSSIEKETYRDVDIVLVGLDFRAVFDYDRVYLREPASLIREGIVVPEEDFTSEDAIVHEGRRYKYNEGMDYYRSIDTYCSSRIGPSPFVIDLVKCVKGRLEDGEGDLNELSGELNPLMTYNTVSGDFLGVHQTFQGIHFFIHGENLRVEEWKRHQREMQLPFVVLHEWPNASGSIPNQRYRRVNLPLPDFIDPFERDRSKYLPTF